ncbi:MAG: cold shock domain-containing protein, partial [Caulobacteraceae bacterium]
MSHDNLDGHETPEESVRISGRVKWFDAGKGYGFIVPDDANQTGLRDVLLHVTSLRNAGRDGALEGAIIVCDVVKRPKGWQVTEIVDLDESAAPPREERPRRVDGDGHGAIGSRGDRTFPARPRGDDGGRREVRRDGAWHDEGRPGGGGPPGPL